jgi:tRNA-2-methylthio-N6-dimethylallyladenosine synthase
VTVKSFYLETFGCQMNDADSELAVTALLNAGYALSGSPAEADLVIYNTCSVRARAEQKVFNKIGELRHARRGELPLIGLMGCVAQLEGSRLFETSPSVSMIVGTRAVSRLPELVGRLMRGERRIQDLGERPADDVWGGVSVERRSKLIALIPIIEGCNKFCTYCIVPYSRGREKSRPADEIIREVCRLRDEGYREVQLIGQNVNSYRPRSLEGLERFEGATPFARLLRAVASTGMPRIKFTTSFPRDFHADIVSAIEKNENLCNWVHLPVQSGSDRVLRSMRRGYKVSDYMRRVEAVKSSRRRIALTSDIIVGFPGETEDEFGETLRLVEASRFDGLYIFKYSERPGTPAAGMDDDVPGAVKTARFQALETLQKGIQSDIYSSYVGREAGVLVEGVSVKSPADLTGHTTCHKVVNFPCGRELIGSVVAVRVTEAKSNSLYGEFVRVLD